MNQAHITTALLTILLAISGWSLSENIAHGKALASLVEAKATSDRELLELRARVTVTEATVARLSADVAVVQARLNATVRP